MLKPQFKSHFSLLENLNTKKARRLISQPVLLMHLRYIYKDELIEK